MSGLLDGRHVPWHVVSGKREPDDDVSLPPPARREPAGVQVTVTLDQKGMRERIRQLANAGYTAAMIADTIRRDVWQFLKVSR